GRPRAPPPPASSRRARPPAVLGPVQLQPAEEGPHAIPGRIGGPGNSLRVAGGAGGGLPQVRVRTDGAEGVLPPRPHRPRSWRRGRGTSRGAGLPRRLGSPRPQHGPRGRLCRPRVGPRPAAGPRAHRQPGSATIGGLAIGATGGHSFL